MKLHTIVKRYSLNLLLLVLTLLLCTVMGEGIARLVLNPGDYLAPILLPDNILKWRLKPGSTGHDDWGYRNSSVPATADIVILGDSQTYSNNAPSGSSWPATVQKLTGRRVYNMALGGYGPVQYYYLLDHKAVELNPSIVAVGFYFGNDIRDAYSMAADYTYWEQLRRPDFQRKGDQINEGSAAPSSETSPVLGSFRKWLGHNSVLYRLFKYTLAERLRYLEMKYVRGKDKDVTILNDSVHNLRTGFTPGQRLSVLNLDDPTISEGLQISLDLFYKMNRFCQERGIYFVVVLIPTKESVYARYIQNNSTLSNSEVIDQLIDSECKINGKIKEFFKANDIKFVDVLDPLREAIGEIQTYPSNSDGHPTKYGYEIIAQTLYEYLKMDRILR